MRAQAIRRAPTHTVTPATPLNCPLTPASTLQLTLRAVSRAVVGEAVTLVAGDAHTVAGARVGALGVDVGRERGEGDDDKGSSHRCSVVVAGTVEMALEREQSRKWRWLGRLGSSDIDTAVEVMHWASRGVP